MSICIHVKESQFIGLFIYLFLFVFSGIADDSNDAKNGTKAGHDAGSSTKTEAKVIVALFVIVVVALVSFSLFKFWQKKKREEQYARLLKLFEEDDELEVELGLRD